MPDSISRVGNLAGYDGGDPMPTILHADMDAFYAAIEQREDPSIRGRPVIVGGLGRRGVVSTASYEARKFGVHSALPMARARKLCPEGVFLKPRGKIYGSVSRQVQGVFAEFTPLVEPLSLDEAFLDVTGSEALFGKGEQIAERIKARVVEATGLTVSVGVASCKFVAKVASDLDKPDGLVVAPAGSEAEFLAPLPIKFLWGAGRVTQDKMRRLGLETIADVQALPLRRLVEILGKSAGQHFHELSFGRDPRGVEPTRPAKSMSHEVTFDQDLDDHDRCLGVLLRLSEGVGKRLRKAGVEAGVVRLKLRFPPFETLTRQRRLKRPSNDDLVLYRIARELFDEASPNQRPVRLLGVAAGDLVAAVADEPSQGQLFGGTPEPEGARKILETMDRIREKFGDQTIRHGR